MMAPGPSDTEELLRRICRGDPAARQDLLTRHRNRLRRKVALRLDRRLAARVDPSDILQESPAAANEQLSDYLRRRPLPFYPWLRQFAWERVATEYERHVRAQRRSVTREEAPPLPGESVAHLACRLIASATSPSRRLLREELRERVHAALEALKPADREVLVLRYSKGSATTRRRRSWGSARAPSACDTSAPWSGFGTCWARTPGRDGNESERADRGTEPVGRRRPGPGAMGRRREGTAGVQRAGRPGGLPPPGSGAGRTAAAAPAGDRDDGRPGPFAGPGAVAIVRPRVGFSLVPSFKIKIDVQDDLAQLYFECHDVGDYDQPDRSLVADLFLADTLRKVRDGWVGS